MSKWLQIKRIYKMTWQNDLTKWLDKMTWQNDLTKWLDKMTWQNAVAKWVGKMTWQNDFRRRDFRRNDLIKWLDTVTWKNDLGWNYFRWKDFRQNDFRRRDFRQNDVLPECEELLIEQSAILWFIEFYKVCSAKKNKERKGIGSKTFSPLLKISWCVCLWKVFSTWYIIFK